MRPSTWSTTGSGMGASGTRCASGTAGGCWKTIGPGWAQSYGGPWDIDLGLRRRRLNSLHEPKEDRVLSGVVGLEHRLGGDSGSLLLGV